MNHSPSRSVRPATAEDFHRLAGLARKRGLRVFEMPANQWWCTSHSDPLWLHVVTGFSCDCPGFIAHQRCSHHALLLEHLGWLPDIEDAAPKIQRDALGLPPAGSCFWCNGTGKTPNDELQRYVECEDCHGTGRRSRRPEPEGFPAIQPVARAA